MRLWTCLEWLDLRSWHTGGNQRRVIFLVSDQVSMCSFAPSEKQKYTEMLISLQSHSGGQEHPGCCGYSFHCAPLLLQQKWKWKQPPKISWFLGNEMWPFNLVDYCPWVTAKQNAVFKELFGDFWHHWGVTGGVNQWRWSFKFTAGSEELTWYSPNLL